MKHLLRFCLLAALMLVMGGQCRATTYATWIMIWYGHDQAWWSEKNPDATRNLVNGEWKTLDWSDESQYGAYLDGIKAAGVTVVIADLTNGWNWLDGRCLTIQKLCAERGMKFCVAENSGGNTASFESRAADIWRNFAGPDAPHPETYAHYRGKPLIVCYSIRDWYRSYLKLDTPNRSRFSLVWASGEDSCINKWGWQLEPWVGSVPSSDSRIVASEADRFLATRPPGGRWNDTKAEENGWTLICISAAANMFPTHPRARAWHEKAIEYMMNTLSIPKDLKDETMVDGRPAREWITSPNLHPDFTLENHGFFHPAYTECSSYFLTQAAMHYTYAHRPVPQAATHHIDGTWQLLRSIMLPCGESAFPQGMDWEQHGLPNINLLASFGTYMKDSFASGMEQIVLQRIRTWQQMQDGNLAVPGSRLGFTRHAIVAEQTTYGYLAHKIFGPSVQPAGSGVQLPTQQRKVGAGVELPPQQLVPEPPVIQRHSSVGFILHRTGSKLFTFSWKYRIMGMLAPIWEGHEGNPHFTVPITNGFVGGIELSPNEAKIKVVESSTKQTRTGFETNAVLLINGERLKQTLRITSLGETAVIYQDSVTALSDVTVARELGVPFGIENDELSGGTRTVHHQDGETIFDWTKPQQPVTIPGSWANVDGRLGIISVAGSGMAYSQAAGYNAQAVCADILYGSFSDKPQTFKAGDQVARRIAVFFVEVTPEETSALARSIRIEEKPGGKVLRVTLPEGGEVEIAILD